MHEAVCLTISTSHTVQHSMGQRGKSTGVPHGATGQGLAASARSRAGQRAAGTIPAQGIRHLHRDAEGQNGDPSPKEARVRLLSAQTDTMSASA